MKNDSLEDSTKIIFFDGVCGLCNRFVDFILRQDHQALLKFAPIQGQTAAARLPAHYRSELGTLVYLDHDGLHEKSEAVLRILAGPLSRSFPAWKLAWGLRIFPKVLRDLIYDFVARSRYRWFGKRELCRLPTAAERMRFLP